MKLETSLYRTVQKVCQYLEPFRRDSRVCRKDRRTDIIIANAASNYVATPKTPTLRQ